MQPSINHEPVDIGIKLTLMKHNASYLIQTLANSAVDRMNLQKMMLSVQSLAGVEVPLTELEDCPKLGTSQEGRESGARN